MARSFHCSIVTPAKAVFDGQVDYVSFQAWDGQMGVLAGQSAVLSKLGIGSVRLDCADGQSKWYLVDGGFAQAADGQLSLITERAIAAEKLSLEEARAELAEAAARIATAGPELAKVEHDQQFALAKKALAEMMGGRGATASAAG